MRYGLKRILRFFSQVDTLAHLAAVPLESQAWSFLIGAWTRALIPARLGRIRNHGRKNRINPDLSRCGRFAGDRCPENPNPISNSADHRWCGPRSDPRPSCDSPRTATGL